MELHISAEEQDTDIGNENDTTEEVNSEVIDDGIPSITHYVVFKCHFYEVLT